MVAVPVRRSPPPAPDMPGPKLDTVEPIWTKTPLTSGCPAKRVLIRWAVSSISATEAPGGPWMSTYMKSGSPAGWKPCGSSGNRATEPRNIRNPRMAATIRCASAHSSALR